MPGWLIWLVVGLSAWLAVSILFGAYFGRFLDLSEPAKHTRAEPRRHAPRKAARDASVVAHEARPRQSPRILIVDDDAGLRMLLRITLTADEFDVAEAEDAQRASDLARFWRPAVVVLDVAMPGIDGLAFCSELKSRTAFGAPAVILLTGTELSEEEASRAGADSLLRKPFSPLELVGQIERLTGAPGAALPGVVGEEANEQLLLYARDLARLLEIERMQRRVLQDAYRDTVAALANTLEAKDTGTSMHSLRVRDYAVQLTAAVEPTLLEDPSLEYGFILHDIGKLGVPNELLGKTDPLTPDEREVIRRHTLIGASMLSDVAFLRGEGFNVIRFHHERWDGTGYPEGLSGTEIPLSARIFAVADAVEAMTGERPYRPPATWAAATREVATQSGAQFDPEVVSAFVRENAALRRIYDVRGKAA